MQTPRTNHAIRVKELRVIGPKGENFGIISLEVALKKAEEFGMDLIEISPTAVPPIAKVADLGKFLYEENKKQKQVKAKSHAVEVKSVQVKPGTGDHDLSLKAKKASEWLAEGNRVRINLFLSGRSKYLDEKFLKERIARMMKFITVEYKIAEPAQRSPKGLTIILERAAKK